MGKYDDFKGFDDEKIAPEPRVINNLEAQKGIGSSYIFKKFGRKKTEDSDFMSEEKEREPRDSKKLESSHEDSQNIGFVESGGFKKQGSTFYPSPTHRLIKKTPVTSIQLLESKKFYALNPVDHSQDSSRTPQDSTLSDFSKKSEVKVVGLKDSLCVSSLRKEQLDSDFTHSKSHVLPDSKMAKNAPLRLGVILCVLVVCAFMGYKILERGIFIEGIHIAGVNVSHIFLRLDQRLTLKIDSIDLSEIMGNNAEFPQQKTTEQNILDIINYTKKSLYIIGYFENLSIKDIKLEQDNHISVSYNGDSYEIDTSDFKASFSVENATNSFNLKIKNFIFKQIPAQIQGTLSFRIPSKTLFFETKTIIDGDKNEFITLNGSTNFENISLNASSSRLSNLEILRPLINSAHKDTQQVLNEWIYEKIKYKSVKIDELKAKIELKDIAQSVLKSLKVRGSIYDMSVTLNKNTTPIISPRATIEFRESDLSITPTSPSLAGMSLEDSSVLIKNIPTPDIIITINASGLRLDSNITRLLSSYGVQVPVSQFGGIKGANTQQSLGCIESRGCVKLVADSQNLESLRHETSKTFDATPEILESSQNIESSLPLYNQILKLNPSTTLTKSHLTNISKNIKSGTLNMHLELRIEQNKINLNKNNPALPLFSAQGIIQGQNTSFSMYGIPLKAKSINVVLDITPKQKNMYISGTHVRWKSIIDSNVSVAFDINRHHIKANTFVYTAVVNTTNAREFVMASVDSSGGDGLYLASDFSEIGSNFIDKKEWEVGDTYLDSKNQGIYLSKDSKEIESKNRYVGLIADSRLQNLGGFKIQHVDLKGQSLSDDSQAPSIQLIQVEQPRTKLTKKEQRYVIDNLENNPLWDSLKIRTKKTRAFKYLSDKELEKIALEQIKKESEPFSLPQDLINIKNANIALELDFSDDKLVLKVPSLSLSLESNLNTQSASSQRKSSKGKSKVLESKTSKDEINTQNGENLAILESKTSRKKTSPPHLTIKVERIENILRHSPLARYYGFQSGSFWLEMSSDNNKTTGKNNKNTNENVNKTFANVTDTKSAINNANAKDSKNTANVAMNTIKKATAKKTPANKAQVEINFILNLENLNYPIYKINYGKLRSLRLNGKLSGDSLVIMANDNIDFKSQHSLSLLRINGYRVDIDEVYKSKIPFLVDLLKDKHRELPYSNAAISQELRLLAIKNMLRKRLKINPFDFNVTGENLQFTFLGYTTPLDSARLRFIDDRISIDGQYGLGILNINMIKDNIHIKARNFSGGFINLILMSAKGGKKMIEGGTFSLDGLYRDGILNATIEIKNTILKELQAVQNIFALIDTLPSLLMFKNPHLGSDYEIGYGKILIATNNDYVGLQNIFLLGNSMDIAGQGIIDISSKEMNMNLSVSTIKNLSKIINKIPIVGYLVLGRDGKISTNLILSGKYTDPKVNITLASDIIKMPLTILKRVFPESKSIQSADEMNVDY